jgi:hypothetical protein
MSNLTWLTANRCYSVDAKKPIGTNILRPYNTAIHPGVQGNPIGRTTEKVPRKTAATWARAGLELLTVRREDEGSEGEDELHIFALTGTDLCDLSDVCSIRIDGKESEFEGF